MDNEAPKYANWIPEAGGYVANGKVVSKSPVYEEDGSGRMKLKVDTSVFGNTVPQKSTSTSTSSDPSLYDLGLVVHQDGTRTNAAGLPIDTLNQKGSGTDVNAMTTGIGSNASLNLNTANSDDSAVSSPATKSNVTGRFAMSALDQANQRLQDAIGRGDLQGQINEYVTIGNLTGQDYSAEIQKLQKQRGQKIMGIDDQYLANYNQAQSVYQQAIRSGDEETAKQALAAMNQIATEQDTWRNQVGYQDAMNQAYQQAEQELKVDYETSFFDGVTDIANTVMQLVGQYLNFQYDPYQDTSLQIAQQYATSRVKEQMNATGMYYSSMTQNAIAKAVGELVPVYEKMAKEEMLQNIQLLQNTANFLVDLEKTQFDIWKSKIQLQLDLNAEKRAQWKQALDASNARGYVNNEEAAILGVEPGSMSQAAREHAQALQEKIDEENRKLQQNMILSEYKNSLDIQKMEVEYNLRDWENSRQASRQLQRDYQNYLYDLNKSAYEASLKGTTNNNGVDFEFESGDGTKIKATLYPDENGDFYHPVTGEKIGNINGKTAETGVSDKAWKLVENFYGKTLADTMKNAYNDTYNVNSLDFSDKNTVDQFAKDFSSGINKAQEAVIREAEPSLRSADKQGPVKSGQKIDIAPALEATYLQKASEVIKNNSANYNNNEDNNAKLLYNSQSSINNMLVSLKKNGTSTSELKNIAIVAYSDLIDSIINAGDNFDFNATKGAGRTTNNIVDFGGLDVADARTAYFNQGDKAKEDAIVAVIQSVYSMQNIPAELKTDVVRALSNKGYEYAKSANGYTGLAKQNAWKFAK